MPTLSLGVRTLTLALAGAAALFLGACSGPSVWEQTFIHAPDGSVPALAASQPVRVRKIAWERMQSTLADIESEAAASDTSPENWTADQKNAAKIRLLRGLQFDAPPESTTILGRSEFRTTETILPEGPDRAGLERYARKVGATDVVWSNRILGRTEKIVEQPVTSYSTGSFWGGHRRGDHDRWWSDNYYEHQTSWVPMRVPADDTGFVAYFLRADGR